MFLSLTFKNKILPSCGHTFLKSYTSFAFFNSTTLLFVRLSVMLTAFPLSFFLVLTTILRTIYLVNLAVMGRGTLLSSLRFPNRCILSISWMVIFSPKSFFTMLIIHIQQSWSISWFCFSVTPWIRRQFLIEYCSSQSSVLPT